MNKNKVTAIQSAPIFTELRKKKIVSPEEYDKLFSVMKDFKHSDFLSPEQGLITLKFLEGENVFGVLPTAGGKSFTFQSVARMKEGLTIVISPLIALMKDLVTKQRDEESFYFNSDLSPVEKKKVKSRIRQGKVKLLYLSPERLKSTDFKDVLNTGRQRVRRLVIDEAHCVVEWGYGFRVKYLHIAQEIEAFEKHLKSKVPVLLLTATASPWLQRETVKNLRVAIRTENFIVQKEGIDRPELLIALHSVKNDSEKIRWIAKRLKKGGDLSGKRGIIFSTFADRGEGLEAINAPIICEKLKVLGVKRIGYYHGKMDLDERRNIQEKFQDNELNVLVATKAFGMGIDLPGLDFIFHFYPPLSLEEYWQEAGRGGRGMDSKKGEYCQCVVLYGPEDYGRLDGFPTLASIDKIISTFTCAVQDEVGFDVRSINPRGQLRKLLTLLHKRKDIRKLKNILVGGIILERWKLIKPASTVIGHIESYCDKGVVNKTDQIRRLIKKLRIRFNRRGKSIRVDNRITGQYYSTELNWYTEPDINALSMIDDEMDGGVAYTRFRILKQKLTLNDMKTLARLIGDYRNGGYAKLDFVFEKFLKAKPGKEKSIILDYLNMKKRPA